MADSSDVIEVSGEGIARMDAIPVRIVSDSAENRVDSAEQGRTQTYFFTGTERPTRILPQSPYRKCAKIQVFTLNSNSSAVFIGTHAECEFRFGQTAGINGGGYYLPSGGSVQFDNQREYYAVPFSGGGAVCVSVIDEAYDPAS